AALYEKDVQIAVVVVVEQGDAGAHHLREVEVAGRAVDVREGEAGCFRRLDEDRTVGCCGYMRARRESIRHETNEETFSYARGAPPPRALTRRRRFAAVPSGASLGPQALHFNRASSRSMAAARSCCPCSSARSRAAFAHLTPSSRWPARTCAVASAN